MFFDLFVLFLVYVLSFLLRKESPHYYAVWEVEESNGELIANFNLGNFVLCYAIAMSLIVICYYFILSQNPGFVFTLFIRFSNVLVVGNLFSILGKIKDLVVGWEDCISLNRYMKLVKIWDLDSKFQFLRHHIRKHNTPLEIRPTDDEVSAIVHASTNKADMVSKYVFLIEEKIKNLEAAAKHIPVKGWLESIISYVGPTAAFVIGASLVIGLVLITGYSYYHGMSSNPPYTDISVPVRSMVWGSYENAMAFFIKGNKLIYDKQLLVILTRNFCGVRPANARWDISIEGTYARYIMRKMKAVVTSTNEVI